MYKKSMYNIQIQDRANDVSLGATITISVLAKTHKHVQVKRAKQIAEQKASSNRNGERR